MGLFAFAGTKFGLTVEPATPVGSPVLKLPGFGDGAASHSHLLPISFSLIVESYDARWNIATRPPRNGFAFAEPCSDAMTSCVIRTLSWVAHLCRVSNHLTTP